MGNSQPKHPKDEVKNESNNNNNNNNRIDTSFPVIEIDQLYANNKKEFEKLVESLHTRSYAVLSFTKKDEIENFHNCISRINNFFALPLEEKENLRQPEGNIGYINIGTIREFIKYRNSEIELLSEQIENFNAEVAAESLRSLEKISWSCLTSILEVTKSTFSEQERSDLQTCLKERASLSVIHYYAANESESMNPLELTYKNSKLKDVLDDSKVDVCSQHQDTGIMTLVMTSNVPGLEAFDILEDRWIALEEEIQPLRNPGEREILILMLGHKAPLFFDNNQYVFQPTVHKVTLPKYIERGSFLYFMDTAKVD